MLVLLFLSIAVAFLLTAAILNSATGDNVEALSVLVVLLIGAIAGFAHILKAARALDALEDATQANVRVRREVRRTKNHSHNGWKNNIQSETARLKRRDAGGGSVC
jgi:Ca2+-transporting ATPase